MIQVTICCVKLKTQNIYPAQGGLFIVHSSNCDKVYVVDMINKRVVVNSNISLKHKFGPSPSILQHLVLGTSGIQLCDQKLIELFGDKFPTQISNTFSEYIYGFGEQQIKFMYNIVKRKNNHTKVTLNVFNFIQISVNEIPKPRYWLTQILAVASFDLFKTQRVFCFSFKVI
ncbi:Hypothetical_protein [Hexamita inflata]|uniref:Hypothetical_protein n=1 Tax=Hexamita inflata TaxID=28002 RepID=A0AA86P369_9EUKA|nr:Hypothetical protein HINF_LOCUS18020 [Hexamita inflata]